MTSKKAGTGETAMKHARAVVAQLFPDAPTLEAQKAVIWIPNGKGGRRPISRREDLFGVFDIMVLDYKVHLIQVTTEQSRSQTATARKRKIEEHFLTWASRRHLPRCEIWVLSWVPRKHFYAWRYTWLGEGWGERQIILSPLMSATRAQLQGPARKPDS